jgi:hypothetical protein
MSLNINAASTLASLAPSLHGKKKGIHEDSLTSSGSAASSGASAPSATESLFDKLLQTVGQVVGIPAITSLGQPSTASVASAAPATGASPNASPASALGRNINATV